MGGLYGSVLGVYVFFGDKLGYFGFAVDAVRHDLFDFLYGLAVMYVFLLISLILVEISELFLLGRLGPAFLSIFKFGND